MTGVLPSTNQRQLAAEQAAADVHVINDFMGD